MVHLLTSADASYSPLRATPATGFPGSSPDGRSMPKEISAPHRRTEPLLRLVVGPESSGTPRIAVPLSGTGADQRRAPSPRMRAAAGLHCRHPSIDQSTVQADPRSSTLSPSACDGSVLG